MPGRLDGKVAVITGATSGIGEATARTLAAQGAKVAVAARRLERLERLAAEIGGEGHTALAIQSDITEQEQAIGEVDVLILPVGGGPTVGGESAAAIVRALRPRLVVPMHYRTDAVNFLDPPDAFLDALGARVERLDEAELDVEGYLGTAEAPTVTLLTVHV